MTNKNNYQKEILAFLLKKNQDGNVRPRKLARQMGISNEDYGDFRAAFKNLRAEGRLLLGSAKALTFPNGEREVLGRFSANPRGFGFVVPEDKTHQFDLFVPEGKSAGAQNGDLVIAELSKQDEKDGQKRYAGRVIEIRERGQSVVVGTLELAEHTWFVSPDGRRFSKPVVIRDVPPEHRKPGIKVKADIIWYPSEGGFPEGVIIEAFGAAGEPVAEIASVMAAYGLKKEFPKEVITEAEQALSKFNPDDALNREDLTEKIIVTIDPDTARDYDDAISIEPLEGGGFRLGVHIADVAHFVEPGGALDVEAKRRAFSVYFPRYVIPMLPGMLSNGLCSLQEGVKRFVRTAFIDYNSEGKRVSKRACKGVICSTKRLTYKEAQEIIDGKRTGYDDEIVSLLTQMNSLAKKIEVRRKNAGMIHLNLPEIELDLDDNGSVIDAHKADESYTHKIIEMFMVEANEAVAEILDAQQIPFIRRIHPNPDDDSKAQLAKFVQACGYVLSPTATLEDLIRLIAQAEGKDESYAINLAVLRSFQRAVYSIAPEGHFALASKFYCHFTSPIRRYPDLVVHRFLEQLLNGEALDMSDDFANTQKEDAAVFSTVERSAQAAETELRLVLVLEYLKSQKGELFNGIVTGVTDFGLFVQHPKFLIEGLIRLQDLGDDWWDVSSDEGKVRGEYSGKVFKIGTVIEVRIDGIDSARRQLMLSPSWMPQKYVKEQGQSSLFHNKTRSGNSANNSSSSRSRKTFKGASMLRSKDRHGRPARRKGKNQSGKASTKTKRR